jgi:hypothetical protein
VATTVPGTLLALDALTLIPFEMEHGQGYQRDLFRYPADADGAVATRLAEGCGTR